MDKEWSERNKEIQKLLKSRELYKEGISRLLELRDVLFGQITQIVNTFPPEAFYQMPFAGVDGYHSKTLSYSIWHIFRIEDITAHELIAGDRQVLNMENFLERIGSPIITTGNELEGKAIADFSAQLDVKELLLYARAVMTATNEMLLGLEFPDLKRRFTEEDRKRLENSGCVSSHENAWWLIAYWCGKDVCGIVKMPFSRHWIMHVEAMRRIKNRLCMLAR